MTRRLQPRALALTLALTGLLGGAGCEPDVATQVEQVCGHVCACRTGLPALQEQCVDDCVGSAPSNFPPGCLACLVGLACDELTGDACRNECSGPVDNSSPLVP